MKLFRKCIVIIIGVFLLLCCQKQNNCPAVSGTYIGMTPCSNCRGVYLEIVISEDGIARMATDVEDNSATKGRIGKWILMKDSIIRISAIRDTFYYKWISPQQIRAIYFTKGSSSPVYGTVLLKKTSEIGKTR